MTKDNNQDIGFAQIKKDGKPHGIVFGDHGRTLWVADKQVASGVLKDEIDIYAYFYELRFLEDFPEVAHWAFGAAWTQRVMIQRPEQVGGDELRGRVLFVSDEDVGIYRVERSYEGLAGNTPVIHAPLPKLFTQALNIPLQIVVAQMIAGALDDDFPYDQWHILTSLLMREEVESVFTRDMAATYGFRFKTLPNDLRQALCELQGIEKSS